MRMINIVAAAFAIVLPVAKAFTQQTYSREFDTILLAHQLTPAGPIPTVLDPNGVYPYQSFSETSDRPVARTFRMVELQNDVMRVLICPSLGGKVFSMQHKPSRKEVLYVPEVIRYTRILPRFYFVAGGIEVSFPISHSPTQNDLVKYRIDKQNGRTYVTCGERELRFGMQWSVEYSLGASDKYLTQRVKFHNPGTKAYPWMSWSNAAMPAGDDTQFDFPNGEVLSHSSVIDTINWQTEGPKTEKDIPEMTGYFWKTKDVNAFGAFNPESGTGLYHIADPRIAGGIKLWSYGSGDDSTWSTLSTASHQRYVEIQGGPIGDQSIKLEMQPGETRWHVEYWMPTAHRENIRQMKVPNVQLRSLDQLPLFEWARGAEVSIWNELAKPASQKAILKAPAVLQQLWAPSGMEKLESSFLEAIANSKGAEKDLWNLHFGVWLTSRDEDRRALEYLSKSSSGVARVIESRIYVAKNNDYKRAAECFSKIKEPWLQLHPQVIVERDKILRKLGPETINERRSWLDRVNALADEWVIERRIQLLIDEGKYKDAYDLLMSTPFQKVHQTYTRTALWKQVCRQAGKPCNEIPAQLGEDRLAVFGAYREFE